MSPTLSRILAERLIAVVRTDHADGLLDVVSSLAEGGISIVEITLTIPHALKAIEQIASSAGQQTLVGAGTILDDEMAKAARDAGAAFLVSPVVNEPVIRFAKNADLPAIPGAYTPTEIYTAWQMGADIVKVFPADTLGPEYFRAIKGPLPNIRLMPTGGVDLDTAEPFLAAGACCLGVGGKLVNPVLVRNKDFVTITNLARQFRAAVPLIAE
jgi:2-dehydro-3-deoxyphosphogluconate aldolase/(4S)-4-hydroxy-2-oxoglutarate aldolase